MSTDETAGEQKCPLTEDELSVKSSLIERFESEKNLPFLFVGSGLSRRYLSTPSWVELLETLANDCGANYDLVRSNHPENDLPAVASDLYKIYNSSFYTESKFQPLKYQYRSIVGMYGASLKIGICSLLEGIQNERAKEGDLNYPEQYSDEICALKNAKVDGVITTNFDSMMEDLLPDFEKLIGQDQMLLGGTKLFGEIYKIHGSIDDPMSLVVTSEDYDSVERKNVYLAAKLLTIFAERPVIFLGYSMGDRYIQRILENVATAAGEYNLSLLSNRLIFVEWEPDPTTVPRMTDNSRQIGDTLIPSTLIRAHSFIPIFEALADLDARLPPEIIRKMYQQVYELAESARENGKTKQFSVVPIGNSSKDDDKTIVGLGMGVLSGDQLERINSGLPTVGQFGLRGVGRQDVIEDVLEVKKLQFDPEEVLKEAFRKIPTTTYVPVWKYLWESGRIKDGEVDYGGLPPRVNKFANREISVSSDSRRRFSLAKSQDALDIDSVVTDGTLTTMAKCDFLALLQYESSDAERLRGAIKKLLSESDDTLSTWISKLIVLYDKIKYSQGLAF